MPGMFNVRTQWADTFVVEGRTCDHGRGALSVGDVTVCGAGSYSPECRHAVRYVPGSGGVMHLFYAHLERGYVVWSHAPGCCRVHAPGV